MSISGSSEPTTVRAVPNRQRAEADQYYTDASAPTETINAFEVVDSAGQLPSGSYCSSRTSLVLCPAHHDWCCESFSGIACAALMDFVLSFIVGCLPAHKATAEGAHPPRSGEGSSS